MKLEQTADGSYTLYVPELDEHYHSVKGALTESQHKYHAQDHGKHDCRKEFTQNNLRITNRRGVKQLDGTRAQLPTDQPHGQQRDIKMKGSASTHPHPHDKSKGTG